MCDCHPRSKEDEAIWRQVKTEPPTIEEWAVLHDLIERYVRVRIENYKSRTTAAPQEPRCLTCGHLHFYETDEGGFDSSDTVPWGKCKTCACKTPNYNKNYEASAAPQEPTPTDPLDPCEGHPIYPTVKPR